MIGWTRSAGHQPALTRTAKGLILTSFLQLAIFGAIFALGWLASRASRTDLLWPWRGGLWTVPLGIVYSVALRFALALAAVFIFSFLIIGKVVSVQAVQDFARTNRPDVGALVDVAALRADPLYFWLTLTLVSFVVAGLREELWRSAVLAAFRILWPRWFGSRPGEIAAVTAIAVVFGLGHVAMGPLGVAAATLLGIGLGVIMVLHRSIWPAVIAHGMFDATTFALLPWTLEKLKEI